MRSLSIDVLFLFVCLVLVPGSLAGASENFVLQVEEGFICKDVVGLTPVGINSQFKSSVGRLYCFSKIRGAQKPTTVTHVWYFGENKEAWVTLEVGSVRWRTYSSKAIQRHQVGPWRVEILGPDVEVLEKIEFEIVP